MDPLSISSSLIALIQDRNNVVRHPSVLGDLGHNRYYDELGIYIGMLDEIGRINYFTRTISKDTPANPEVDKV